MIRHSRPVPFAVDTAVSGEAHSILKPYGYLGSSTKRLLVFSHGAAADNTTWGTYFPDLRQLALHALPLITSALASPTNWGDDAAQTAIGASWTYGKTQLTTKTDKMMLVAQSMGGPTALNYTRNNPANVAALVMVAPVVDIDYAHDNNVQGSAAAIEAAYTDAAGYEAALATHNPIANAAAHAGQGVPIKFWYATNDIWTPQATFETFAAQSGATAVNMGAVGHTGTNPGIGPVLDFLLPYLA